MTRAPKHVLESVKVRVILLLMLKDFLTRKMLTSQLGEVPAEDREKLMGAIEENPELFRKIAEDVEAGVRAGKDKMAVTFEIVEKYKTELAKVLK
jgi:hypothetical protein